MDVKFKLQESSKCGAKRTIPIPLDHIFSLNHLPINQQQIKERISFFLLHSGRKYLPLLREWGVTYHQFQNEINNIAHHIYNLELHTGTRVYEENSLLLVVRTLPQLPYFCPKCRSERLGRKYCFDCGEKVV